MPYCTKCGRQVAMLDDRNLCDQCRDLVELNAHTAVLDIGDSVNNHADGLDNLSESIAASDNNDEYAGQKSEPEENVDQLVTVPSAVEESDPVDTPNVLRRKKNPCLIAVALFLFATILIIAKTQSGKAAINRWIRKSQYDKVDDYLGSRQYFDLSSRQAKIYLYCLAEAVGNNYERYWERALTLLNDVSDKGLIEALGKHGAKEPDKMVAILKGYTGSESSVHASIIDILATYQNGVADSILLAALVYDGVNPDSILTRTRQYAPYIIPSYARFGKLMEDLSRYDRLNHELASLEMNESNIADSLEFATTKYNDAMKLNSSFREAVVVVEQWVSSWEYQVVSTGIGFTGRALLCGPYNMYGGPALGRGVHRLIVCRPPEPLDYQVVTLKDGTQDYWPVLWTRDTLLAQVLLGGLKDGPALISKYRNELTKITSDLNIRRNELAKLRSEIETQLP